jgi:hypothetical protein
VHDARARAAQRTRAPEIPQTQRQSQPLGVEHLLPVVLDALGTTGPELACHPRKRARARDRSVQPAAVRRGDRRRIAGVLGVSSWHASSLARAREAHWNSDARLTARVRVAFGNGDVEPIQQT